MNARPPSGVTDTARVRPGRATGASAWLERVSSRNALLVLVATTTTRARATAGSNNRSVRAARSGRTRPFNTVDCVQSRSLWRSLDDSRYVHSMFRKLKVALGAGSATVDTVLSTGAVRPGDRVQGVVHVGGGEIEQEIEPVTVALQTVVEVESGDSEWASTQTFASTHVADGLVLHPG